MDRKEIIIEVIRIIVILTFMIVMVFLPIYGYIKVIGWMEDREEQLKLEEDVILQAKYDRLQNERWCKNNKNTTVIDYDLITYYNMTCEEIKFNIENWVKKYSDEKEYVGGGGLFSSGSYQYVQKYYGVGHINILKNKITKVYPQNGKCYSSWSITENPYLEQDFVNYYTNNCMINSSQGIGE